MPICFNPILLLSCKIILVILNLGLSEKFSCICGDVNLIKEGT